MASERIEQLATLLKQKREELGLSGSEVARRAGVDVGTIWRIEHAQIAAPQANSLKEIARVLQIPVADLFTIVDLLPEGELPSLDLYLRAKFGSELTDEDLAELESTFAKVTKRHGHDSNGPAPGQDE